MRNIFFNYVKFLLSSTNEHGIHSPFVFQLVTEAFYKQNSKKKWTQFLTIKKEYLKDNRLIGVTDFGAGSKVFKSNRRRIGKIAKVAGISNKKAAIVLKIVQYFKPKAILEIGTSIGLGSTVMSIGNPKAKIKTIEGCKETATIAKEYFKKNNFENITVDIGSFEQTLPNVIKDKKFDCIYFDGNHTKNATLKYFNSCLSSRNNNTFWVFDDIYLNSEMQEAWEIIKKRPEVTVTIDLFQLGIVFFRKEQAKEHFKIRC